MIQHYKKHWFERRTALEQLRRYLAHVVPKTEYFYSLFGCYILTVTYLSYSLLPVTSVHEAAALHYFLQSSITFLGSSYIIFPLWSESMQRKDFLIWFWPASLFYALFFVGSVLAIAGNFESPYLFIWSLNLVMAVLMLPARLVLSMAVIGVLAARWTYLRYPVTMNSDVGSLHFKVVYGLLLCSSFLIALFKHKQAYQKLEQDSEHLARDNTRLTLANQAANQELLETFKEKLRLLRTLEKAGVQNITKAVRLVSKLRTQGRQVWAQAAPLDALLQQLTDTITPMAQELEGVENRAMAYLQLHVQPIPIQQLLEETQAAISEVTDNVTLHIQDTSQMTTLECDPGYLKRLLVDSVIELHKLNPKQPILLGLATTQLAYLLPSVRPGYIKNIDALGLTITTEPVIPTLQKSYTAQMTTIALPKSKEDQAMLHAKKLRIVKAHYGYTNLEEGALPTQQHFVIPTTLYQVRPKETDEDYMELGADVVRADDHYPGAQAQEKRFLQVVKEQTQANMELVITAIEMIKWYHGPVKRKTGEPFYLHPLTVAHIVLTYDKQEATLLGALLHDTVEDTPLLLETIAALFGQDRKSVV